jgi:hypothetical protein
MPIEVSLRHECYGTVSQPRLQTAVALVQENRAIAAARFVDQGSGALQQKLDASLLGVADMSASCGFRGTRIV